MEFDARGDWRYNYFPFARGLAPQDNQSSIKLFRNSNEPDKTNPNLICYFLANSIDNPNELNQSK